MKKHILTAGLAALLLAVLLVLASCGGGEPAETTAPATSAPAVTSTAPVTTVPPAPPTLEGLASYTVIYPEDPDEAMFRALVDFIAAVEEETGVRLEYDDDFVRPDETVPTDTPEILVGVTNRAESAALRLGRDDYTIFFENDRLVIAGGTPEATAAALAKVKETYLHDGALYLPVEPLAVRGSYPYGSATLLGVDIHDYVIVHDSRSLALAEILRDKIADATGAVLPILMQNAEIGEHEIRVGSFSGDRETATVPEGKFTVEKVGAHLSLRGAGEDGAYSAVMSFLEELAGTGTALTLDYASPKTGDVLDMALYTLNLPDTLTDLGGKYDISYSAESVLERFLATRAELPEHVTVVERIPTSRYPLSERTVVYVSPDGDDAAAGTKEAPLRTLEAALAFMANKNGGIIYLREGVYSQTASLKITAAHSGTRQAPLFIKAYEGEKVMITSNTPMSGGAWYAVDPTKNRSVYDRIPEEALPHIRCTTLEEQGWTEADLPDITTSGTPNLYVNGEEYVVARFPNETINNYDLLYFNYVYDTGTVTARDGSDLYFTWVERATAAGWDPKTTIVGWEIRVINEKDNKQDKESRWEFGDEILSWVNTGDIWYYGSCFEGWEFGYYNLALETEGQIWAHNKDGELYDPATDEVAYLGAPKGDGYYSLKSMTNNPYGCKKSTNSSAGRNTFYLFNAIEALDAPGEWFYDKDTGYFYIYPEEGHEALSDCTVSVSNSTPFSLIDATRAKHLVFDGLTFDGSAGEGLYLSYTDHAVIQNCTFLNTVKNNLTVSNCYNVGVIYCDFSAAYTTLLSMTYWSSTASLKPLNSVIQNCFFHDPKPLEQTAISWGGCRLVVSHNYFNNMTTSGSSGVECIFEYNRFEGGSKDVTDGGMIYKHSSSTRGNHYRYNLFHMFNATHNAIYNDGMASGNYSYNNVISTLHSTSDHNKPWYSSTGWGNVHYANINILRNPLECKAANAGSSMESDENVFARVTQGDMLNESALFYYYFGDEHAATTNRKWAAVDMFGNPQKALGTSGSLGKELTLSQSLAGHWWTGMRTTDVKRYLTQYDQKMWNARAPEYINMMKGTQMLLEVWEEANAGNIDYHVKHFYVPWYLSGKSYTFENVPNGTVITVPEYRYLSGTYGTGTAELVTVPTKTFTVDGAFTLTYEEIASMERARRAPMYSVVMNNVILGGTPIYKQYATQYVIPEDAVADRTQIITDSGETYEGRTLTTLKTNNFMSYLYDDIMPDAKDSFYYEITEEGWETILSAGAEDPTLTVEEGVIEELKYTATFVPLEAGFTFWFDYGEWFDDVYPHFYD